MYMFDDYGELQFSTMECLNLFRLLFGICVLSDKGECKFDPIAFDVQINQNFQTNNPVTVPFTSSVTNHNFARLRDGVFTCTKASVYKFQVYAVTSPDNRFFLDIAVNDTVVASLFGHGNDEYGTAGNVVIVRLDVGDTVKVNTRGTVNTALITPRNSRLCTFLGIELGSMALDLNRTGVAFSVTSSRNQIVSSGQTVQYDTQLLHQGSFSLTNGEFNVPISGFYIFHFVGFSQSDFTMWMDLMQNSEYVCSVYGKMSFNHVSVGNTVILHAEAGDNVTIQSHGDSENHMFGNKNQVFSSFSGALLISDTELNDPASEPVVMFSAGLSNTTIFNQSRNVIYDKLFVNLDNAYNNATGEFRAPTSGLYEFNVHGFPHDRQKMTLMLYHNNIPVTGVLSEGSTSHIAGNAAILELAGGDTVSVKVTDTLSHAGTKLNGDAIYNTFSGHLLYANTPDTAFVG